MKICKLTHPLLSLLLVCAFVLGAMPAAFADNSGVQTGSYEIYIDDEADLLTDAEEQSLRDTMSTLTVFGNMMFTTVTLDTYNYEAYAENAYYDRYGNEPGINFQVDMGNRQLTLSASTAMEDLIGGERDSIVDNIYTYASGGDYFGCANECFTEIYNVLHGIEISHKMKHINNAIIALILGLMINFLVVFASFRTSASKRALRKGMTVGANITDVRVQKGMLTKEYSPQESSGGGGGGFSGGGGGGGGGGGFSGGSSSHGF